MGYAAVAVGPRDLVAGVDFLKKEGAEKKIPMLSANLVKDGKPVFQPWIIVRKNGLKIGLIGLSAANIPPALKKTYQVVDPVKAVKETLPYLYGKTDALILLSNAGHNVDIAILKNFPEINVVAGAGVGSSFMNPLPVNKGFILRSTPKGKAIGEVRLLFTGDKVHPLKVTGHLITLDKRFEKDPEITKKARSFEVDHRRDSVNALKKIFGGGASSVKGSHNSNHSTASNPFLEAIKRSQGQKKASDNTVNKAE